MATDATNTAAIAATIPVLNMLFIVFLLDPVLAGISDSTFNLHPSTL
jgi:hypothetical protein